MPTTPATDAIVSHLIVEQSPDAIIFADTDGVVRLWNGGAERIFGHASSDMICHPMDILIPGKLLQAPNNGFHPEMTRGERKYVNMVLNTTADTKEDSTQISEQTSI